MNKIRGYAIPKADANGTSANDLSEFRSLPCRALDINMESNSVLLINMQATALGMFDLSQISNYFKCSEVNGLLVPDGLSIMQEMEYFNKVFANKINQKRDMSAVRKIIIAQSLSVGKFCDFIYFNSAE